MSITAKELQLTEIHSKYDKLQTIYGSPNLDSIYGAGCIDNPDICLVFMNPTGKNLTSDKMWTGLKAPWLNTKNTWKLLYNLNLIDEKLYLEIKSKKPIDWDNEFCLHVYKQIADKKIFITNLGKCTQEDARHLNDNILKEYLSLLEEEIELLNPKIIITFGNQVSSIFLKTNISVSKCRGIYYDKVINGIAYKTYPVYYPVGQGMRNINIAIEDIEKIIDNIAN